MLRKLPINTALAVPASQYLFTVYTRSNPTDCAMNNKELFMAILHANTIQTKAEPKITIGVKWINIPDAVNIYCGQGSPLGNPYAFKNMSLKERDEVCDKFAIYLKDKANRDTPQRAEMIRILELYKNGKNINLQCYCANKRCHCETIKELIINAAT